MDETTGSDKPRVVFIEYGIGFGGSTISLSELVRGLMEIGAVTPTVVTFQPRNVTQGLFPADVEIRAKRWLNYRTRSALERTLERWAPFLSKVGMKAYAVFDFAYEFLLSLRLWLIVRSRNADVVHLKIGRAHV